MGTNNRSRRRAKQSKRKQPQQQQHRETRAQPVQRQHEQVRIIANVELAQRALCQVARAWPAQTGQSATLLHELARPEAASDVEEAAALCLTSAADDIAARGWRRPEAARVARKGKRISAEAQSLVLGALSSPPARPTRWPDGTIERQYRLHAVVAALAFLFDLPRIPSVADPGERPPDPAQARMLDKVRALLAKAESTEFDEEAETYTAKAQELMARYAIDEATVEAGGGKGSGSEVGMTRVAIDDPYAAPKVLLLQHVARANRCRSMWIEGAGLCTVFGTAGDLRVVEMLFTSLLVQAVAAMRRAGSQFDDRGRSRTRSFRQSFVVAFGSRIGERLQEANRAAAARAIDEIGDSFLPVLVSRDEAAERACGEAFPKSSGRRVSSANMAGHLAGRAAADVANIDNGPGLPESRSA